MKRGYGTGAGAGGGAARCMRGGAGPPMADESRGREGARQPLAFREEERTTR